MIRLQLVQRLQDSNGGLIEDCRVAAGFVPELANHFNAVGILSMPAAPGSWLPRHLVRISSDVASSLSGPVRFSPKEDQAMSEQRNVTCPECGELTEVNRREFMKGVSAAALAISAGALPVFATPRTVLAAAGSRFGRQ
jgi:hypothetical protein